MLQAFVLALLVWSGHIVYWEVLLLAALLGFANTLDLPTRQSYVPELVDRRDISSAVGLNSAIVNVARMIGPALSAVLMARYGAGPLFFLNGLSFIPVLIGLYLINTNPVMIKKTEKKVLAEIMEGLRYIRHSPIILVAVLSMLAVGTFVMNFNVIIPIYATVVLKQDVHGFGILLSASGAGSLIGALLVASRVKDNPSLKILVGSGFLVSVLLVLLNFIHSFPLAVGMFAIIGFINIIFIVTVNSAIQLNSSKQFMGRVMSVYSFAFLGTTPIGNLFAGSITEKLGPGMGFLLCGVISGFIILLLILNIVLKKDVSKATI